jgi:hypothetical protein
MNRRCIDLFVAEPLYTHYAFRLSLMAGELTNCTHTYWLLSLYLSLCLPPHLPHRLNPHVQTLS